MRVAFLLATSLLLAMPVLGGDTGTNLDPVEDFSPQYPFVDAFKQSRFWITQNEGTFDTEETGLLDLDADGWLEQPLVDQMTTASSVEVPLAHGRYYWRVTARDGEEREGETSELGRFTLAPVPVALRLLVDQVRVRDGVLHVRGRTEPGATVRVAGQVIPVQPDGAFSEFLTARSALARVTIVVTSASGAVLTRELAVTP